jgi:DNA-binding response OmpR family regulator
MNRSELPKVLVLDDDQIILDLLRTVLTDAGYTTITAARPDALETDPRADLVITDLVPLKAYRREPALEWIQALRRRFTGVPLFIISAHAAAAAEPDMLGADAILPKPFDVEDLLATVERLVGHMRKTP